VGGCLVRVLLLPTPVSLLCLHQINHIRFEKRGTANPKLRLVPVLGEETHGKGLLRGRGGMLLFGRGLQLLELLGVGVALGVEGLEGVEGGGGERPGVEF